MNQFIYRALRSIEPDGRKLYHRQKQLEQSQWLSHEQLKSSQLSQIQNLIAYAYEHVPYYQNLFNEHGIVPQNIKTFDDFERIPFLTREDINNHLKELVTNDPNYKIVSNSTGGSTGVPMHFFVEGNFDMWDPALELRGRGWYGVKQGEKLAFVWGANRDMRVNTTRRKLKSKFTERYLNAFDMTEDCMQEFADELIKWKPAMFRAYASALTLFAQYLKEHGIAGIRPKLIETTAEKVTLPQRELLEEVFQCKVADWYSAREMGTIAYQCPAGSLHVCETRYLEVVANGQLVQPGELGEVVITSLHQYGMPFIRYKIGDMAIYETEQCSCGRGLPVLREVVGRLQDFLVATDGHYIHGGYFPHTFRLYPEIARYQVYQPDRNHVEVRLVCNKQSDATFLARIHNELQENFGADMQISVDIVDSIPLTPAGKHRFIISDVKPDFV